MALEFDQPETLEGGSTRCSKVGTYHVVVVDYVENPEDYSKKIVEGGFEITCEIVQGTESSEIGKTIKHIFRPPSERHKDGGKFALLCMTKFYLAINKGVHQPGVKAVLQYDSVAGRQFLVQMKEKKGEGDKVYIEIDGANFYHVDDITKEDVPKSAEYLAAIPAELRVVVNTSADGNSGSANLDDL